MSRRNWLFVAVAYGLFAVAFLAIGAVAQATQEPGVLLALQSVASWTPTIAVVVLFRRLHPDQPFWPWLKDLVRPSIPARAWATVLTVPALVLACTVAVAAVVNQRPWADVLQLSPVVLASIPAHVVAGGPMGEELGWRGYLLRDLRGRHGVVRAALLTGLAWSCWHWLPWLTSGFTGVQLLLYVASFVVANLSLSVIMAILFDRSQNLLLPIAIHFCFNWTASLLTVDRLQVVGFLAVGYLVAAAVVVWRWKPTNQPTAPTASPEPDAVDGELVAAGAKGKHQGPQARKPVAPHICTADDRDVNDDVTIRPATPADHQACELLIRDAFWDLYRPGCHEHYVWHRAIQGHPDVIPGLTFVACDRDTVVGCVMSTMGCIHLPDGRRVVVLTPGPIAVDPRRQHHGIGALLMEHTLAGAAERGFGAAFLYGSPAYYPRFGFADAATFGVTTAEGDNFPDFMAMEFHPGALAGLTGRLVESSLFEFPAADVDAFDETLPPRRECPDPPRP